MKVTGHWVRTPRSNTMVGSFLQAASTAGVSAAVVFGETMSKSQAPLETKASMSEICLSSLPCASATVKDLMSFLSTSTCACMLVQPTTRHGLKRPALEKQIRYGPGFLYCAVSTSLPSRCCSQGLSGGPCGVIARRSLAAWNSFGSSKFWASAPPATPAKAAPAIIDVISLNIISLLSSLIADARRFAEREGAPAILCGAGARRRTRPRQSRWSPAPSP